MYKSSPSISQVAVTWVKCAMYLRERWGTVKLGCECGAQVAHKSVPVRCRVTAVHTRYSGVIFFTFLDTGGLVAIREKTMGGSGQSSVTTA